MDNLKKKKSLDPFEKKKYFHFYSNSLLYGIWVYYFGFNRSKISTNTINIYFSPKMCEL